jgi:hypothetical protein
MYEHRLPYAADADARLLAAAAILFRINWRWQNQVFHVCMIWINHNSHVWPATNSHAAPVHWHQQHFTVNAGEGIVHYFLIWHFLLHGQFRAQIYWMLMDEKLPETYGSSMMGLRLTLHVRSHCHLQQWIGWVCSLDSQVTGPHTNGLLPIGPH